MKICVLIPYLTVCFFACTGNKENHITTYQLVRSDYIERINATGTVQAVSNTPVTAPRSNYGMMTVTKIAEDGSFVRKGDTLCVVSVPEVESMHRDLLRSIEKLEAELAKAQADNNLDISIWQGQLESAVSRVNIASLDTLKMQFVPTFQQDILRLELKKAIIEKDKIEKKLASTKKIGESDMRQKKAFIVREKMRAQSLADQIKSMTLIAEREGMVMRAESPIISISSSRGSGTIGGPVREGTVLAIDPTVLRFPDLSRMQVSADVPEADFKRIEKGQKVNISVDAAGMLFTTGKVNRKSLATGQGQRYSQSKVKSYEVIIDVDSCHTKMKPGLSAICEIIIKEVKDTLFVPTIAIFQKDSADIIYVKQNNEFIPVRIETGTAGNSYTILTSGLAGNETIALTKPPDRSIVQGKSRSTFDNAN